MSSLSAFLISVAAVAALVPGCDASRSVPRANVANAANACPFQTPLEWETFLRVTAGNPDWGPTCEDSTCDSKAYQNVKENVAGKLDACRSFLNEHPVIARCTDRLKRFSLAWMRQHDDVSYGFNVDNKTYLDNEEGPGQPEGMMTPPPGIIEALPDQKKIIEVARQSGFKYLVHDSSIDGVRTFVLVPDPRGRFDQWFLLNLQAKNPSVKLSSPLSLLAVQKKDAAGRPLAKVRLHFRDYTISPKAEGGFRLTLNYGNNGKCYACHPNGVRQLIGRVTPVLDALPVRGEPGFTEQGNLPAPKDFAFQRLLEFNRRLRSYGSPDWQGNATPEDYGPMIGSAQHCVDCHDGKSRAALNVLTSLGQLEKKTYYQLSMPPDNDYMGLLERNEMQNPPLTTREAKRLEHVLSEQADLTKELIASRLPLLRSWLTEVRCD